MRWKPGRRSRNIEDRRGRSPRRRRSPFGPSGFRRGLESGDPDLCHTFES